MDWKCPVTAPSCWTVGHRWVTQVSGAPPPLPPLLHLPPTFFMASPTNDPPPSTNRSPLPQLDCVHLPAAGDIAPALLPGQARDLQLLVQSQGETKTVVLGAPAEQDGLLYFRCGLKYTYKLESEPSFGSSLRTLVLMRTFSVKWSSFGPHCSTKSSFAVFPAGQA